MARGESLGQAIADESCIDLDAYVREGARQMLQRALDGELEAFLADHADRTERDKSPRADERVAFTSAILPPYLRKSHR